MATSTQGEVIFPDGIAPGRNRTGSAIAKGLTVEFDSANGIDAISVTNAEADRAVGVTMEPIADGANGNVCKKGKVLCKAGGAITAGARVAPGADGRVVAAGSADVSIGRYLEATTCAENDMVLCDIDCTNPPLLA